MRATCPSSSPNPDPPIRHPYYFTPGKIEELDFLLRRPMDIQLVSKRKMGQITIVDPALLFIGKFSKQLVLLVGGRGTVQFERQNKMVKQETFLQRLETLGYYSLPRSHPKSPGYSGLLVVLRQAPQGHEPEWVQLRLHEWNGITSKVHLHADMNWPFSHVVCPGQIVVRSRQEPEATFYSFGGTLETEALAGEMVFSLRSAAPVLELLPEQETIADLLADETEALFARARAQQLLSSQQLLDRLVEAGPEAVYLAVLQSLLQEDEEEALHYYPEFVKMLNNERDWYQKTGRWPLNPRDLTILLRAVGA